MTCDLAMTSDVYYHDQGQGGQICFQKLMACDNMECPQTMYTGEIYHFKVLIPSVAAGAIIGKGGGTIVQLQNETGTRIIMSKATEFYPGTTERVCLISGTFTAVLSMHDFIMEKIKEKPDPNAKMGIDFDQKQPAEREKQVKILVPNSTAGMIIGKGGNFIRQIKEESGAYVQISQKSKDHALAERCITVIGEIDNNKNACRMILSKIAEDSQSDSCLNVSYAGIAGPVANFNPTGSPFANAARVTSAMNSSTTYSSNSSLNSPLPNTTNSFQNSPMASTHCIVPFSGFGLSDSMIPLSQASEIIESMQNILRGRGYSEHTIVEISAAMNTLANYGLLGDGLGILNEVNCPSNVGTLGFSMSNPFIANYTMTPAGIPNQEMFTSVTGIQESHASCNSTVIAPSMEAGSNLFGPIGSSGGGYSELIFEPSYTTPNTSHSNDGHFVQSEAASFQSFHRTPPTFTASNVGALPINENSFGLGTSLSSGTTLGKSHTSHNTHMEVATRMEVKENIVGVILGPGGKLLVDIQRFSGALIQISKKGDFAPGTRKRIVTITGLPFAVQTAVNLIEQQIAEEETKRAEQNAAGFMY